MILIGLGICVYCYNGNMKVIVLIKYFKIKFRFILKDDIYVWEILVGYDNRIIG